MRMLALGLFASTALCTSSFAADLSAPAAPADVVVEATWSGFYAGLEAGYAFGDKAEYDFQDDFLNFALGDDFFGVLENDLDGLLGGFYAGFNYQTGNFVLGLEGSFSGADISGSELGDPFGGGLLTAETETQINWLATATGRIGYLVSDNFLIFAKGGAAFAEIESSGSLDTTFFGGGNLVAIDASETAIGFTVGAGGEFKFADNWSAKVEYNYVRFDDVDFTGDVSIFGGLPVGPYDYSADVDLHLVKAGIAYHF